MSSQQGRTMTMDGADVSTKPVSMTPPSSETNPSAATDTDSKSVKLDGKQLVVTPTPESNQTSGAPISFALTDAQFERALTVFTPPERTKANLWTNQVDHAFVKKLISVVAYLESVQYMRPCGPCFGNALISNHFDNVMIEKFGGGDGGGDGSENGKDDDDDCLDSFSIDTWFNETRGEVPKELQTWNPKGDEPMPVFDMQVDWYGALTVAELAYEGFVELFNNCILLEEEADALIAKRKRGAGSSFGSHPGDRTVMPAARHQQAAFKTFTPSGLLGGHGSGMQFPSSGLL